MNVRILVCAVFLLQCFPSISRTLIEEIVAVNSVESADSVSGLDNEKLQVAINKWLGTPYKSAGTSMRGTDCSGFVMSIFREVYGIELPHSSCQMCEETRKVRNQKRLREGDLVFFKIERNRVSHVGIFLKDGIFVHASTQNGVEIMRLSERYYKRTYYRGGRVKGI